MLVKATQYAVTRDSSTTIVLTTTDYEALILAEIFGKENVKKLEASGTLERDETEESSRLAAKYGLPILRQIFGADYASGVAAAVKKAKAGATKSSDNAAA